ncbi:PulJ/GspJ family protein [Catenuloplanes japonicus]|uniref:PulJ/GspJ family protein n=1 Tax=Catenuloplanes japonicus TaxID=33876 RepID=UPI000526473F|nr:type II secretion system protein [Catenuloplanes japonicus]
MNAREHDEERDAGITMIEMVVVMAIMSVLMVLFTSSVVTIYRTFNKVDATNAAQEQVNNVFLRLDKEVRYAQAVSTPLIGTTVSAVEYMMAPPPGVSNPTCVQLRLRTDTGQLQQRSWVDGTTPSGGWVTLLSGVAPAKDGVTTKPAFSLVTPSAEQDYQRLRLNFTTTGGGAGGSTSRITDITFTALNTTGTSPTGLCNERTGL